MTPPIRWRLHLPVPPEEVYAALATDDGRAAFWAESAREADGAVEFRFVDGTREASPIVLRDPPRAFALTYFGALARFDLAADGHGGTDLLLTQTGVPADEWTEVHAGWLNVLLPLKAWLAHRVDLRNHDPTRTWRDGYVDQ